MANIRWAIFCAATKRTMPMNLNWQPYYDILAEDMTYRERLVAYAQSVTREWKPIGSASSVIGICLRSMKWPGTFLVPTLLTMR